MLEIIFALCAYTDLKYRKIPDFLIILIGIYAVFFSPIYPYERVGGFMLCFIALTTLAIITKKIKGGDVKFLSVCAGALGITRFLYVLILTTALSLIYSILRQKNSVPLAFMFAGGYALINVLKMLDGGYF